MPHGISGAAISVNLAAAPVNFKLTGWRYRSNILLAGDTGAGELFESRIPIRGDWEAECTGWVPDQSARHVLSVNESIIGTEIALALKQKASDTNPVVLATGTIESLEYDASSIDGPIACRFTVRGSLGTGPAYDTTPTGV